MKPNVISNFFIVLVIVLRQLLKRLYPYPIPTKVSTKFHNVAGIHMQEWAFKQIRQTTNFDYEKVKYGHFGRSHSTVCSIL